MEYLTDKLERLAIEEMDRIEKLGGMLTAISEGYIKKEILNSAYSKQMDIESGRRVIVGVNAFQPARGSRRRAAAVLPERLQRDRVLRRKSLTRRRELGLVREKLERLRSAATARANLMPSISDAARAGCTVGEISDTLRDIYGVYKPRQPV